MAQLFLPASIPSFLALIVGNFVALIGIIILFAFQTLSKNASPSPGVLVGLGVALGWCTVKFHFCWLFLIFLAIDSLR
jgi:hypothetical protein